ncbi:MAG: type VI secretion system membrane subunit TssM [Myxococcota bacterium]
MLKYLIATIVSLAAWIGWWLLQDTVPLWAPIVITVLAIAVVTAVVIVARVRAARAAKELENALSAQASSLALNARPDLQPELEEIQGEFEKAVKALKSSKLGAGRRDALYVLPWYLIIGPSGCGKTTAILNSDLQLPHIPAQGRAVRGIGGTRNCDWWFTNEGILLDTAGRWSTEDEDREEWIGFLGFLKKYRKRKPVNGIIAAVSIAELGEWSPERVAETASKIRTRIDEAQSELHMSLPVYVVFMKCDLVAGFVETFGGLTKEQRSVVWGFATALDDKGGVAARFDRGFDELMTSLESFTMRRLDDDRRQEVRHKVFSLPQQMLGLKDRLSEFVENLFEENVFSETPMLRGVYFVSGTQGEGRPFDHVLQGLSRGYGLEALPEDEYVGEKKGYFLRDLFRRVIFADKDLALRSAVELVRQRRLYYASIASLFLLSAILLVAPAVSCMGNRNLIDRVANAGTELAMDVEDDPDRVLPPRAFMPLVEEIETLNQYDDDGVPVKMGAGLYTGDEVLGSAQAFLGTVLEENVLVGVYEEDVARLAEFGRTYANRPNDIPSRSEYILYWDRLRRHLLMTGPKDPAEPRIRREVAEALAADLAARWAETASLEAEGDREEAGAAAQAYVSALDARQTKGFSRNREVVDSVRSALSRVSGIDLTIDGLIRQYKNAAPPMTVRRLVGAGAPSLKGSREVRPAFTRKVWDAHLKELFSGDSDELLGEMWVLGDYAVRASAKALADPDTYRQLVRSRYLERYIDEWREFIRGLHVEPAKGESGDVRILEDFTRGQPPPLGRLFRQIDRNVDLRGDKGAAELVLDALGQERPKSDSRYIDEDKVYRAFEGFLRFGIPEPTEEGEPPIPTGLDAYQEQLVYLRDAILAQQGGAPDIRLQQDLRVALARAKGLVNEQEVGWRPAFDSILLPPIRYAIKGRCVMEALVAGQAWCDSVKAPFDATIRNGFPFRSGQTQISMADFAAFYRPNDGALWSFYNQYLSDEVPRRGSTFSAGGASASCSDPVYRASLVEFLNESWRITSSMFPSGATEPRVDFEVRIKPAPSIARQVLSVGGRSIDYYNAPEAWTRMSWPGEDPPAGARLEVRGATGLEETITPTGDWGFFQLLALGSARSSGSTFTVSWNVSQAVDVRMDFRSIGPSPFFKPTLLGLFRSSGAVAPREIVIGNEVCGGAP